MPNKEREFIQSIQDAAEQPLDQGVLLSLVGYNCRRAYLTILAPFQARMVKLALRPVEFTALSLLKSNPNINQKRLSQAINVSPPNLALLLDRLEGRGLVLRQRNPLDKRSQTLMLTPEGVRLCGKAEKTVADLDGEASAVLTDAERTQLLHLLQKIYLPG